MGINIPGIDTEKALELYDDDLDIFLTVLRSYAESTPAVIEKLRNVSPEMLPDYLALVHGVKGTSSAVGAEGIREITTELESLAKSKDFPAIAALNKTFLEQADLLLLELKSWLDKVDSGQIKLD